MTLSPDEKLKHVEWLRHEDIRMKFFLTDIPEPWFDAFRLERTDMSRICWFSALVPPSSVPQLVQSPNGWDIGPAEGTPAIWRQSEKDGVRQTYWPFGNELGIEPLVILRHFHGIRPDSLELTQEFRLYHNLFHDSKRKRFLHIDQNGDESEAARYGGNLMEIRSDLLRQFCAVKQMALAIYVESFRYSPYTLAELDLSETRINDEQDLYNFPLIIAPDDLRTERDSKTAGLVIGAKKYILPEPMPTDDDPEEEVFQEFIIGSDSEGSPIRSTCNPDLLSNYFGKNPDSPHYVTPVFFRAEVMAKYYDDPTKYSVEDGYLRCGGLWGLRIDNDHTDYVVVYLGDLGRDLSETERNYWLSFNIPPQGRSISRTNFQRSFMAEFADAMRPDLVFKRVYTEFNQSFKEAHGWEFFLPLHPDDSHFFTGLRTLSTDSQAEFDTQLLGLTKLVVDSLNEKRISNGLATLSKEDKGITKLEKFLSESGATGFETHIKFLRVLQDLRSKSAAHRKGSNYELLIEDLGMADEGQSRVFSSLLNSASDLIRFFSENVLPEAGA